MTAGTDGNRRVDDRRLRGTESLTPEVSDASSCHRRQPARRRPGRLGLRLVHQELRQGLGRPERRRLHHPHRRRRERQHRRSIGHDLGGRGGHHRGRRRRGHDGRWQPSGRSERPRLPARQRGGLGWSRPPDDSGGAAIRAAQRAVPHSRPGHAYGGRQPQHVRPRRGHRVIHADPQLPRQRAAARPVGGAHRGVRELLRRRLPRRHRAGAHHPRRRQPGARSWPATTASCASACRARTCRPATASRPT